MIKVYAYSVCLNSFVNGIININQSNMNDGVSALCDIIHSYNVTCILACPKQANCIEVSEEISKLSKYGKDCKSFSNSVITELLAYVIKRQDKENESSLSG